MAQCVETNVMAGETTRTEHRNDERVYIMLNLEGPGRPESLELTWGQWQSLRVFCFSLSF